MAVRYSGHMVRTRRQAVWLNVFLLLVLLPLVAHRFTVDRVGIGITLAILTLAPFVLAWQAWRFLEAQERVHAEPTSEMTFVFRFLANTPLTFGGLMFVLLVSLG